MHIGQLAVIDQAQRIVNNRFDFKGVDASFERDGRTVTLTAEAEFQVTQMEDMLRSALIKCNIDSGAMHVADPVAAGKTVTQSVVLRHGLDSDQCRRVVKKMDDLALSIPLVKSVYGSARQLIETFYSSTEQTFESVVLMEYPRKGLYTVGLVTAATKGELRDRIPVEVVNVFVPTTPNPTSGILVLAQRDELIFLDMDVEEALRFVVSAGIVSPPPRGALPAPSNEVGFSPRKSRIRGIVTLINRSRNSNMRAPRRVTMHPTG